MTTEDLLSLLTQSRERNAREEITGFLAYHHGGFVQVLEGPEQNVRRIFDSILRDPRHHSIVTVLQEPITEREFAGWHMAFRQVDRLQEMPPGYSDFLNASRKFDGFSVPDGLGQSLLLSFKESLR